MTLGPRALLATADALRSTSLSRLISAFVRAL